MSDRVFIDTNILLYAYDLDAGAKREAASDIVRRLWADGNGALSTQVLQEFYVNVTMKIAKPISQADARAIIGCYLVWHVEVNTPNSILHASEIQERHRCPTGMRSLLPPPRKSAPACPNWSKLSVGRPAGRLWNSALR